MILLRERDNRTAHRCRNVLVDCIQLQWLRCWQQQVLALRYLQALQEHLLNLAEVVQLRHLLGALHDGLYLSKPLSFTEDVGVADWHDVHRAFEVLALDHQLAGLVKHFLFIEVSLVQAEQHLQHTAHGIMQTSMNGREHCHALLKASQGGTDWCVGVAVSQFFERGPHDVLTSINQEAKQLKQHATWRVVRHWHQHLADVVLAK